MKMFLLGILVMSIISTVFTVISENSSHEELTLVACGPAGLVLLAIVQSILTISKMRKHIMFKALVLCPDGQIRYVDSNKEFDYFVYEAEGYDRIVWTADLAEKEKWDINDWPKTRRCGDSASLRYTPKKVWKRYEKLNKSIDK